MRYLKYSFSLLLIFTVSLFAKQATANLHDVNIFISNSGDVAKIQNLGITPEDIDFGYVKTLLTSEQIDLVKNSGFEIFDNTAEDLAATRSGRANFPSFQSIMSELQSLANSNSSIAKLDTIGFSTSQNIAIVRMTITGTDNSKPKPVYNITGTTHGNEKVGSELIMDFADAVLSGYGSDNVWTNIVDNCIIQLIPAQCPDGYLSHSRYLSGNIDPNRQFGWQVGLNNGSDNHSTITFPFQNSELVSYYNNMNEDPWYFCMDYHTGIKCVMVPWFADVSIGSSLTDYVPFKYLGDMYLDEMPSGFTFQGKGLWMGGMESQGMPGVQTDWPYSRGGTLSLIVEASLSQSQTIPSEMPTISAGNIIALKNMMQETQKGVSGIITSKTNDEPIFATVEVVGEGFPVLSSPKTGSFFKYIKSLGSSYSVKIRANGYNDTTVTVSVSSNSGFNNIDVKMNPREDDKIFAMSLDYLRSYNRPSQNDMHNALGEPDNEGLRLESSGGWSGTDGAMLLFFGNNSAAHDLEGDDITIYSTNSETYEVYAGNEIDNINIDLGSGSGDTQFDLAGKGVDSVKFIKIVSTGGNSPEIDAVEGKRIVEDVANKGLSSLKLSSLVRSININNNKCIVSANFGIDHFMIKLLDMKGRTIIKKSGFNKTKGILKNYSLDLSSLSAGNYIVNVNSANMKYSEHITLIK